MGLCEQDGQEKIDLYSDDYSVIQLVGEEDELELAIVLDCETDDGQVKMETNGYVHCVLKTSCSRL